MMMGSQAPTGVGTAAPRADQTLMLQEILSTLKTLQQSHSTLAASVAVIEDRVSTLTDIRHIHDGTRQQAQGLDRKQHSSPALIGNHLQGSPALIPFELASSPKSLPADRSTETTTHVGKASHTAYPTAATTSSKIILSTYPHQSGIDPITMVWGDPDPMQRGPVVVSRAPSTIRRRNGRCTGFHSTI